MHLSLQSISAGAMTAAVSLGSSMQAFSAQASSAMAVLPQVTAGGMQALSQGASTAAATLPTTVHASAASASTLAGGLGAMKDTGLAISRGIPKATLAARTAGVLGRVLPIVTIGASSLAGARIVADEGADALVNTKAGRAAALGAMGGTLLLIPTPGTQLAAAGVLGAVAANQFGGLDRLDGAQLRMPPVRLPWY